jgi:hypothetical protein
MPSRAGFHLSRVVIVESLKPGELKTGLETANFVRAQDSTLAVGIPIEYHDCDSAQDFTNILASLNLDAIQTQNFPLLQVECHGDDVLGLEFRDASCLSWPQLSELLAELNKATRFNLISVFSACYGGYFLSRLSTVDPAPCYAMLAPTEAIWPHEILAAFRTFYSEFFRTMDAGRAMSSISKLSLESGSWMPVLAESWYEHVVINYIQQHCTRHEMKIRTLRTANALRASGVAADMHKVKLGLVQGNRESITGKFFERYFMVADIPENATRFSSLKLRIEKRIHELRATGRYGI